MGEHYRRTEERHQVKVFNQTLLFDLISEAGFEVRVSDSYGDFKLATRRLAYIAQKTKSNF
jgi:hypothetical protein